MPPRASRVGLAARPAALDRPFPRTRRLERVAENAAATQLALSADDIAVLNTLAESVGVESNRYNDHHMALVGR
jgi:diketogulonate reductase-like aldo/keto reductase